jgi:rhodanese-related sulfurtransferase
MSPAEEPSDTEIDPEQLVAWMTEQPQLQVIDVRQPFEREAGHIAGTEHIELVELPGKAAVLSREQPVVFYCRVGNRSLMAAQAFRASGFEAYSLQGGVVRWAQEGRALEPAGGYVADD